MLHSQQNSDQTVTESRFLRLVMLRLLIKVMVNNQGLTLTFFLYTNTQCEIICVLDFIDLEGANYSI